MNVTPTAKLKVSADKLVKLEIKPMPQVYKGIGLLSNLNVI